MAINMEVLACNSAVKPEQSSNAFNLFFVCEIAVLPLFSSPLQYRVWMYNECSMKLRVQQEGNISEPVKNHFRKGSKDYIILLFKLMILTEY